MTQTTIQEERLALNAISRDALNTESNWQIAIKAHVQPNHRKAIWQLINTFIPYIALWGLMIYSIQSGLSYWITLGLIVLSSGFLARIFIFFHDCGHGSFFASQRANRWLGYLTGILTFTPYEDWRHAHAIHHATAGDLDRRGVGDVWTMTAEEYLSASRAQRTFYRIYRNPFVMFGLGPAIVFLITQRLPHKGAGKRERQSVWITNAAILAIVLLAHFTIGLRTYLLIQIPLMLLTGSLGIWLFYVQHNYEGVYWVRHEEWDPVKSALEGSSYYKLPKVLQWLTGNIGLHHIHHLRPRIPNYRLQECFDEIPAMQEVEPVTLKSGIKTLWLKLWDEDQGKMISFSKLRASYPDSIG
jgi:omega-6 fatty acid desaturase (delta-12 desaturase)